MKTTDTYIKRFEQDFYADPNTAFINYKTKDIEIPKRSFLCNACQNYNMHICEKCLGIGYCWEPINKDFYEREPEKFMEYLISLSTKE